MIFASQRKSKKTGAILLGEVHSKEYHMGPGNRLDTKIASCIFVSHR
jgi:hypothetical protein